MQIHENFTKDAPYKVRAEYHWDYYKEPPIRYTLYQSANYADAVSFAMKYYDACDEEEMSYPNILSIWISPEPPGLHFDYEAYIEYALARDHTG